jgi:hypothetical protein
MIPLITALDFIRHFVFDSKLVRKKLTKVAKQKWLIKVANKNN